MGYGGVLTQSFAHLIRTQEIMCAETRDREPRIGEFLANLDIDLFL